MGFGIWFKMWWMSFFRLLTCGSKPRKSERQRKKERERRLKAKYSSSARYRIKKQRKRRRSSHNAANLRTIRAVFGFLATTFSIVLLPFGLFHWGYKSAQVRRRTNASKTANTRSSSSNKNHNTANRSSKGKTTATTNSTWSTDHRPTASTSAHPNRAAIIMNPRAMLPSRSPIKNAKANPRSWRTTAPSMVAISMASTLLEIMEKFSTPLSLNSSSRRFTYSLAVLDMSPRCPLLLLSFIIP